MTPPAMDGTAARSVLADLTDALRTRDLAAVLASFSSAPTATYLGSEVGERATGAPALARLFTGLIAGDAGYSFDFSYVSWGAVGMAGAVDAAVWIVGEGRGTETRPGQDVESFPYRVSGVLVWEGGAWRWAVLVGSEPTSPAVNNR